MRDIATFDFFSRNERLQKDKDMLGRIDNKARQELGDVVEEMVQEVKDYNKMWVGGQIWKNIQDYFEERSESVKGDFMKAIKFSIPKPTAATAYELDKLTKEERVDLLQGLIPGGRKESAEWMVERKLDYIWLDNVRVYFSKIDQTMIKAEAELRPEYRDGLKKVQRKLLLEPLYILRKQGEIDRKNYPSLGDVPG